MAVDPYAAPKSRVADVSLTQSDGDFDAGARGVPAGNGWSWISQAWALFADNRGTSIGLFVLFIVIVFALSMIPLLGQLALYFVGPVFSGGIMLGCDALRRGEKLEIGHLFAGFRNHTGKLCGLGGFVLIAFIAIFALIFLMFGAAVVGMFTGGLIGEQPTPEAMTAVFATMMLGILVLVGLSIPVYMALWFAPPLIVLNDMGVGAALKASFFACLKNILPFLVWSIAFFFLAILATIPIGLGWLLLGPVLFASVYTGYRDIFYDH